MPRRPGEKIVKTNIWDNMERCDVTFSHRLPTTKERIAFSNEKIRRVRNKVIFKEAETRIKYALMILKGIPEGHFERKTDDGKFVPVASDPESKNFYDKWKDVVYETGADLLETFGAYIYEGSAEVDREEIQPDEDSGEPADPS